ncbi:MAG: hypothetical protein ABEH38_09985 [Flavobacteriales bacterium]
MHFLFYRPIHILTLPVFLMLFAGCGGKGDGKDKGKDEQKDSAKKTVKADTTKSNEKESRGTVLPNSLQVASSFKKAGLPYKDGLILPPGSKDQMVDPNRKKLAFGAYSADLAYLVLNQKGNKAQRTMKALMELAKGLNLSSVFKIDKIAERFKANIDKRDSLLQLIVEVQKHFDTYVAKNRTRQLRTIAYAGGWTEAMYLAAHSGISEKKRLHLEVEEQMTILDKLLKALGRDVKEPEGPLADLLKELKAMDKLYKKKAPKPGKKLPKGVMKKLKERADNARTIISNKGSS